MRDLTGKVAFITGGSSGIGLGIAKALTPHGVAMTITGTNAQRLSDAAAELEALGAPVRTACFDVTDRAAFERAADTAEEEFGPVDILCNNAGRGFLGSIVESTPEQWRWMWDGNVMGVINGIQVFVPRMRARAREAHIMATASAAGLVSAANGGIYTATKMAVVGIMESLRSEVAGDLIGVSVFCPHLVRTNIHEHTVRALGPEGQAIADAIRGFTAVGMAPEEAGRYVVDGIRNNRLYVLSHQEIGGVLDERHAALRAALTAALPDVDRVAAEAGTLSYAAYLEAASSGRSAPDQGPSP